MISAMLVIHHFVILSRKMNVLANITMRIAPTLYVGYAIYALTSERDFSRKREER